MIQEPTCWQFLEVINLAGWIVEMWKRVEGVDTVPGWLERVNEQLSRAREAAGIDTRERRLPITWTAERETGLLKDMYSYPMYPSRHAR